MYDLKTDNKNVNLPTQYFLKRISEKIDGNVKGYVYDLCIMFWLIK